MNRKLMWAPLLLALLIMAGCQKTADDKLKAESFIPEKVMAYGYLNVKAVLEAPISQKMAEMNKDKENGKQLQEVQEFLKEKLGTKLEDFKRVDFYVPQGQDISNPSFGMVMEFLNLNEETLANTFKEEKAKKLMYKEQTINISDRMFIVQQANLLLIAQSEEVAKEMIDTSLAETNVTANKQISALLAKSKGSSFAIAVLADDSIRQIISGIINYSSLQELLLSGTIKDGVLLSVQAQMGSPEDAQGLSSMLDVFIGQEETFLSMLKSLQLPLEESALKSFYQGISKKVEEKAILLSVDINSEIITSLSRSGFLDQMSLGR